jgi:hypothetical protein
LINYLFQVLKIYLKIIEFELNNLIIDLSYDDKKYKINYPQNENFNILLTPNFLKEKQTINLIILEKKNKKYFKIAKGELNIFKKYFIGDKLKIEKWVYLNLYKSFINNLNLDSQEINSSKIYITIKLLEPIENLKNENNKKDNNKKINPKKLNLDNNNHTNSNENIDDLQINNQFDDDLSDLSISLIEDKEEKNEEPINIIINDDYIQKLKHLISSDFEKFLPKDIEKLKQMNELLYNKFTELSNLYNENLIALNNNNEEIRQKAKKYYEDYKKLKKEIYKGRVELKKKNKELKNDIDIINEDNKNIINQIEKIRKDTQELRNKLNITNEEDKNDNFNEKNDIKILKELLLKVNNLGYDIFTISGLNDEEKNKLKILLNVEEKNNEKNENVENNNSDENIKDDIELGNLIVSLIERDVNDLYSKQIIDNVKIDQINAITYSFENKKLTKNVTLKIQNDNLFCDNGVSFNSWLINNFGI